MREIQTNERTNEWMNEWMNERWKEEEETNGQKEEGGRYKKKIWKKGRKEGRSCAWAHLKHVSGVLIVTYVSTSSTVIILYAQCINVRLMWICWTPQRICWLLLLSMYLIVEHITLFPIYSFVFPCIRLYPLYSPVFLYSFSFRSFFLFTYRKIGTHGVEWRRTAQNKCHWHSRIDNLSLHRGVIGECVYLLYFINITGIVWKQLSKTSMCNWNRWSYVSLAISLFSIIHYLRIYIPFSKCNTLTTGWQLGRLVMISFWWKISLFNDQFRF